MGFSVKDYINNRPAQDATPNAGSTKNSGGSGNNPAASGSGFSVRDYINQRVAPSNTDVNAALHSSYGAPQPVKTAPVTPVSSSRPETLAPNMQRSSAPIVPGLAPEALMQAAQRRQNALNNPSAADINRVLHSSYGGASAPAQQTNQRDGYKSYSLVPGLAPQNIAPAGRSLAPAVTDKTQASAAQRLEAARRGVENAVGMNTEEERQAAFDEYNAALADYQNVTGKRGYRTMGEAANYVTDQLSEAIPRALDLADVTVQKGLTGIAQTAANFNDFLSGNVVEFAGKVAGKDWSNNFFRRGAEAWRKDAEKLAEKTYQIAEGNPELVGLTDFGSLALQVTPVVLLAYLTGGASLAPSAAGLTSTAALAQSSSLVDTIAYYLSGMLKNPNYWVSLIQESGNNYEEAKNWTKDNGVATRYALLTSLINGGIEIGLDGVSGIQGFEQAIRNGDDILLDTLKKSMLEEGNEELTQGLVSRAMAGAFGNENAEVFSTTNPDAVFNPVTMGKEYAAGAAIAGILGGGQMLAQNILYGDVSGADTQANTENVDVDENGRPRSTYFSDADTEEAFRKQYRQYVKEYSDVFNTADSENVDVQRKAVISEIINEAQAQRAYWQSVNGSTQNTAPVYSAAPAAQEYSNVQNAPLANAPARTNTVSSETMQTIPQTAQNAIQTPIDESVSVKYYADGMTESFGKALTENYKAGMGAADYAKAMTWYYNAGRSAAGDTSIEVSQQPAVALTPAQMEAAYKAGISDAQAVAPAAATQYNDAVNAAENQMAPRSNEEIWNADRAKVITAGDRTPDSYRYETFSILSDGTELHVFYDDKAKADAATRNAVAFRGEGTQAVVDLQQPGALEQAMRDVANATDMQLSESETRLAGGRQAAEEARIKAQELERRRLATMNVEEDVTNGRQDNTLRERGKRVLQQRESGSAGEVSEGTRAIRKRWGTDGTPAEVERGSLRYGEKINLREHSDAIADSDNVYKDVTTGTATRRTISALANKNGISEDKIVLFGVDSAEDGFTRSDGGIARAFYDPETGVMGVMTNNKEVNGADLWRHELAEMKIADGKIDTAEVIDSAKSRIDPAKIDRALELYGAKNPGVGMSEAMNELVCDSGDHINQLRYDVTKGKRRGSVYYSALADELDEVVGTIHNVLSEMTGGAFDVDGEEISAKENAVTTDGETRFSSKAVSAFLRTYLGDVKEGEYISLSNAEKAFIGSNIKSGNGIFDADATTGRINGNIYCYLFETRGKSVVVTDIIDVEELNIHSVDAEDFYDNEGANYSQKFIQQTESGGNRQGNGNNNVVAIEKTGENGKNDRMAGRSSESDGRKDIANVEGNSAREISVTDSEGKGQTKFSMKLPVEETADLVALHNLSSDKLNKALDLGGFPMPSIAVTKSDIPHTNFGDITLVMNKSTVDPKADRRNTVYSADAWTPTFPRIEYEADEKVASALRKRYYDMYRKYGDEVTRPLYPWGNYANDELTRRGGVAKVISDEKENTDMMKLYLLENGMDVPAPVTEEKIERIKPVDKAFNDFFIQQMGEEPFKALKMQPGQSPIQFRKDWWEKYGDAFEAAYSEYGRKLGFSDEQIRNVLNNETVASQTRKAVEIRNYIANGGEKRTVTTNITATQNAIRAAVDEKKYDAWLHGLFDGLEKSSGIYNGKDRYTPSGNLRSFAATHNPVTLDGIAKAMASENNGNSRNVSGFYGVKSLRAGTAKRFSSIADMHNSEGRLRHVTQEQADEINDALSNRLTDVSERIYSARNYKISDDNIFIAYDAIGEILMEISEKPSITVDSIEKTFSEYNYKIGNALAIDIRDLLFDVSQMPVNIFEAKPERAVRFDEVLAAVLPDDASSELKNRLSSAGVTNIITYKAGDEADRLAKVNSVQGAKFSTKLPVEETDSEYLALAKDPVKNEAQLQAMVDDAAKQAGFDPTSLYHGTKKYGFTKFDLSAMDDGASIFLTDNKYVAESYAGTLRTGTPGGENGEIVGGIRAKDAKTMPLDRAVSLYNELNSHNTPYQILSRDKLDSIIKKEIDAVHESGELARRFLDHPDMLENYFKVFEADDTQQSVTKFALKLISDFENANTAAELREADDAYTKFIRLPGVATNRALTTARMLVNSENLANSPRFAAKYMEMRGHNTPLVWDGHYSMLYENQIRDALYDDLLSEDKYESYVMTANGIPKRKGIYKVYANYGKMLTVDAAEKNWDSITFMPDNLRAIKRKMKRIEKDNFGSGPVTNNPEWVALDKQFWDEADRLYNEYGINVGGYNTTREISAYAKANGYDSVKFEEITDISEDAYDRYSSDVYIMFDPDRVKSADPVTYDDNGNVIPLSERFRTDRTGEDAWKNSDLRYSRKVETLGALQEENDALKEKLAELKTAAKERDKAMARAEYWQGQTRRTQAPSLRQGDVDKLSRTVIQDYSSTLKIDDISPRVKSLGEYILRGGEENGDFEWATVKDRAVDIARDVCQNAEALASGVDAEQYKEIKSYLRRKMSISAYDSHDIPDFNNWRKARMGQIAIGVDNGGLPIDTAYKELTARFPDYFPEDVTAPSDQLLQMAEVYDTLQPIYENPNSIDMAMAIDYCANDIVSALLDEAVVRETPATFADRQAAKLDAQKAKDAEKLSKVRAEKDAKIKELREIGRWETARAVNEVVKQRDAAISALKQHFADKQAAKLDAQMRTRLLKLARRMANKKLPPVTRALVDELVGDLDLVAKSITGKSLTDLAALQKYVDAKTDNESPEYDPNFILDKATLKKLKRFHDVMNGGSINDLSPRQLADLTEALLNVEHAATESNKAIRSKMRHDMYVAGVRVIQDINNSPSGGIPRELNAQRAARRIAGYADGSDGTEASPIITLMDEMIEGERRFDMYVREAVKPLKKFLDDKKFMRGLKGKRAREITVQGWDIRNKRAIDVKITPDERVMLFLHEKSDDNMRHIQGVQSGDNDFVGGGLVIPDIRLLKQGQDNRAYSDDVRVRFTREQVRKICRDMSEQEREYAMAIWRYLNVIAPPDLNATSVIIDGYEKFHVDNYAPINVDKNFIGQDYEGIVIEDNNSLSHPGFSEARIQSAKPIYLRNASDVFLQSVRQNAAYICKAVPLMNMNKLLNVQLKGAEDSVQGALNRQFTTDKYNPFSVSAVDYLQKFMRDYAGNKGRTKSGGEKLLAKARKNYSGGVLGIAAGTGIKQAASYFTAGAIVSAQSLARAANPVYKVDVSFIDKDTAVFTKRTEGFTTLEMAELTEDGKHIPRPLNFIQGVDVGTTALLKRAAAIEVQKTTDYKIGTPEYKRAVVDMYIQIIEETQPNYSVALRPDVLRSDSDLERALVMFATQPMQNYGLLYDAINDHAAKRRAYTNASADQKASAREAYRKTAKKLARVIGSQFAASLVFALMQYAWDVYRGKDDKYKKDGEWDVGTFAKAIGLNMLANGAGMFIGGKIAIEIAETIADGVASAFGGKKFFNSAFYGVETAELSAISDAVSSMIKATNAIAEAANSAAVGEDVNIEPLVRKTWTAAEDALLLLGIPLENATTMATSLARTVCRAEFGKYVGNYYALRITTSPDSYKADYYDNLYAAYNSDKNAFREIYNDMIQSGDFKADGIKSAMESRMKDAAGVKSVKDLPSRFVAP